MKDLESDMERASTAGPEELESLVYHKSPEVISRVINNKNLTEPLAVIIAGRKDIDAKMLEFLARHPRWKDSYKVKLALCKNPRTPQKITLYMAKYLKIFDLADLTRNNVIPANLRIKIESNIYERLPGMALGIKVTLAKRVSGNVLLRLMEEGHKEAVAACLDSPLMTEGDIYKVLNKENIPPQVIRMIASHPRWSLRYLIRWALILNNHAPLSCIVNFLKDMKTSDLKEIFDMPGVPSSTRPYIHRELLERGVEIE